MQIDFTSSGLLFEYQAAVNVSSVSPSQGSSQGGTVVTISGSGFPLYTDIRCRFNDFSVLATYVSETEVTCITKKTAMGFARVDVTVNNNDYSESKTIFEFIDYPTMTAMVPYQGTTKGGTTSFIKGSSYTSPNLKCNYGGRSVTAPQFHSTGEISCISPADSPIAVAVGLHDEGDKTFARMQSTQSFAFQVLPTVTGISPTRGPIYGGTKVTVAVSGYNRVDQIFCRFGDAKAVIASWINSYKLQCLSPAAQSGNVTVEVSNNGQDFTTSGHLYNYHEIMNVTSFTPMISSSDSAALVTITGSNFPTYGVLPKHLQCRFGAQATRAVVLSSTSIRCDAPTGDAGIVSVGITSNGGVDVYHTPLALTFEARPRVFDIFPRSGTTLGSLSRRGFSPSNMSRPRTTWLTYSPSPSHGRRSSTSVANS